VIRFARVDHKRAYTDVEEVLGPVSHGLIPRPSAHRPRSSRGMVKGFPWRKVLSRAVLTFGWMRPFSTMALRKAMTLPWD